MTRSPARPLAGLILGAALLVPTPTAAQTSPRIRLVCDQFSFDIRQDGNDIQIDTGGGRAVGSTSLFEVDQASNPSLKITEGAYEWRNPPSRSDNPQYIEFYYYVDRYTGRFVVRVLAVLGGSAKAAQREGTCETAPAAPATPPRPKL